MTWSKRDSHWQESPRLLSVRAKRGWKAGACATMAFDAVLSVNGEHDCDGALDPLYASVQYLGRFTPLVGGRLLTTALDHLVECGLIGRNPDGGITIEGWDETWRTVKPSTARVNLHRQRKAAEKKAREAQQHDPGKMAPSTKPPQIRRVDEEGRR